MSGKIILLQLPMPKNTFKLLTINYYIKRNVVYNEPPSLALSCPSCPTLECLLTLVDHPYTLISTMAPKLFHTGVSTHFPCREDVMCSYRYTLGPQQPIKFLCLCNRRRPWHPTPVLLPGKSHGRRSLVGCSPWGR